MTHCHYFLHAPLLQWSLGLIAEKWYRLWKDFMAKLKFPWLRHQTNAGKFAYFLGWICFSNQAQDQAPVRQIGKNIIPHLQNNGNGKFQFSGGCPMTRNLLENGCFFQPPVDPAGWSSWGRQAKWALIPNPWLTLFTLLGFLWMWILTSWQPPLIPIKSWVVKSPTPPK